MVVVVAALSLPDEGGDPDPPTSSTSSTTVTTAPPAAPAIDDFTARFTGVPGEGDDLVAWLEERKAQVVHLDLTFAHDEPVELTSPPLWTDCSAEMPNDVAPSTDWCGAWVLYVRSEEGEESPFFVSRGVTRLEGYFRPSATDGPHQGYYSFALDPVDAQDAVG